LEGFTMTTTTTRRAILAGAATLPALATSALAAIGSQSSPIADPIFAAIEAHRLAYAERSRCLKIADVIPQEDAPPGAKAAADAAGDAEYEAMIDLLNIRPATTAGLAALLQYAVDHGAEEWMDVYIEDGSSQSFMGCLVQHAAETLAVQS
jgi:hypothetical protein